MESIRQIVRKVLNEEAYDNETPEKYEPKRWAYVGKPMTLQVYKGDRGNAKSYTLGPRIRFYTTNKLVAQTYGHLGKVKERTLKLNKPYIWEFNQPIEFNESEVNTLMTRFENALIHINKTGTDYVFHRFSDSYVIPKDIDGIIVENIVDIESGEVDVEDEFSDEFRKQMELYNGEVIILYT